MTALDLIGRITGAIVALVLVLLSAWLILRWIGKKMPGVSGGSARLIQVLDRYGVGRGSTLLLIRVQSKVMLVAISEHTAEKLCEFDDPEEKITSMSKVADTMDFSAALSGAIKQFKNRGNKGEG